MKIYATISVEFEFEPDEENDLCLIDQAHDFVTLEVSIPNSSMTVEINSVVDE